MTTHTIPREFVDAYGQLLCPLRGCRQPVHFERTDTGSVHVNVELTLQSPTVGGFNTETWQVVCEGGHTLLVDSDEEGRGFDERPDYSDDADVRHVDDMARLAALYTAPGSYPSLFASVLPHPDAPGRVTDRHRSDVYVEMSPEEARRVRGLGTEAVVLWHEERWTVEWDDERSTPHDQRAWLRLASEPTTADVEPDLIPRGTPVKLTPVR